MNIALRRSLRQIHNRAQPLYWLAGAAALVALCYALVAATVRLGGRVAAGTASLFLG